MTPKIRVVADPYQNASNWYDATIRKYAFHRTKRPVLPEAIASAIASGTHESEVVPLIMAWRQNEGDDAILYGFQIAIQKEFEAKREEIFRRMLETTGLKPFLPAYTCYLSTWYGSPYDEVRGLTWVYYDIEHKGRIRVFLHEYQHMLVHHYFEQWINEQVGADAFDHIKEALTVLLNQWYTESFMGHRDHGYPMHQLLREEIEKNWQQTGNFRKVLQHSIRVYPKYAQYHVLLEVKKR